MFNLAKSNMVQQLKGTLKITSFRLALVGGIACAFMVAQSASAATVRSSANYGVQFDSIAAGSGAMSSASYSQPQMLVGQNVIWNHYTNSGFDFQPTGTFLVNPTNSRVPASIWQKYQ